MARVLIMMKRWKNYGICFTALFFLCSQMLCCTMSPLKVRKHKRFQDGFFSFMSREVVTGSSVSIFDDQMYFGTGGGKLISYDLKSSSINWKVKTKTAVEGTARVWGKNVYFGNSEGYLYSVDSKTGKINWEYKAQGEITSEVEINPDGMLYFSSADGVVTAVDVESGEWLWHYRRDLTQKVTIKGISSPVLIDKEFVVVGFADGFVVALNPNDGTLLWERKIDR